MKTSTPKRKVFHDAVDLLGGDTNIPCDNGITMLPVDEIRAFHNHPFHLYEGERLQDMVESIKEYGVLNPVIVRKYNGTYEMLSGHNRQNAAKLAGIKEIPAIVKEKLSEEEAYVYVIETNLMQRSFSDLSITEKAAVLAERYDKVLYQRKREEIVQELAKLERRDEKVGHSVQLSSNRDVLGEEYGLSGRSVARLMRVNHLIPEFKEQVDKNILQLMAAVQLSYLPERCQKIVLDASKESGIKINKDIATRVRNASMTEKGIREAVMGVQPEPHPLGIVMEEKPVFKPIKLSADIREKYFQNVHAKEIEGIVDKALEDWFKKNNRKK